jgi:hypothetical protein
VLLKVECLREDLLPWVVVQVVLVVQAVQVVLRVALDLWVSLPIRVLQVVSAHQVLDL